VKRDLLPYLRDGKLDQLQVTVPVPVQEDDGLGAAGLGGAFSFGPMPGATAIPVGISVSRVPPNFLKGSTQLIVAALALSLTSHFKSSTSFNLHIWHPKPSMLYLLINQVVRPT
jgi:hypothetical protein